MRKILVLVPLVLSACATVPRNTAPAPAPAPEISMPPPNSIGLLMLEPKGCEPKKELVEAEPCTSLDQKICSKNLNQKLSQAARVQNATHVWIREESLLRGMLYKKGTAYDCTEFLKRKNQGAH